MTAKITEKLIVRYGASVHTLAGWRSAHIRAHADKISEKRVQIVEVITIDDEAPVHEMSRTGANRQRYNGVSTAAREAGKIKNLSACEIEKTAQK